MAPSPSESRPLLPTSAHLSSASRSKLQARRYLPQPETPTRSEKSKGKQRALDPTLSDEDGLEKSNAEDEREGDEIFPTLGDKGKGKTRDSTINKRNSADENGRAVTIIFSNEESAGGNLEVWIDEGESVAHVKEKIRHLRPSVDGLSLRLIHSGRLLTDGVLLLPWLRSLEDRVRRQAAGVGGDVGEVLREVGLADGETPAKDNAPSRVWLHCNVGGPVDATPEDDAEAEPTQPRRRGFDVLLDAGLSADEVALMRRQFYESRGEEVPEGMDMGDVNDEHARALEEQWIEGDLTAETATTSTEGMYESIFHGLLVGFLIPLMPWFFFRELPLPNFFDAEAEADSLARREEEAARMADAALAVSRGAQGTEDSLGLLGIGLAPPAAGSGATTPIPPSEQVSSRVSSSPSVGGESVTSVVFGKRMQMGIIIGTLLNLMFGVLRFLN